MIFFWLLIYNILIVPLGYIGYYIVSFFDEKIKIGKIGRKITNRKINWFRRKKPDKEVYLIHSASLGEYEQAKPVIRGLKTLRPDIEIVCSFTSPSGYENADKLEEVSLFVYLPIDTLRRIDAFLTKLRPSKIIFVSYELWPNLIMKANRYEISTYLMSARIRKDSLKWLPIIRTFFSEIYRNLDHIYAVTQEDKETVARLTGSKQVKVLALGDTRYDQVIQRSEKKVEEKVPSIFETGFVFVAGSIWPQDAEKLLPALFRLMKEKNDLKLILAPHEPSDYAIEMLETQAEKQNLTYKRLTELNEAPIDEKILLVDKIGVLAEIYHQTKAAFVGGSFRDSIHNVMEPAVAGIPVFFGPVYHNSREAENLVEQGGAVSCETSQELYRNIKRVIEDEQVYNKMSRSARKVIVDNLGASMKTVKQILE